MPDLDVLVPARMDSGTGNRNRTVPASTLNRAVAGIVDLYAGAGIPVSPSRASRIARRSLRARAWTMEVDAIRSGLLPATYPDPTGDTAVWNGLTGGASS